MLNRSYSVSRHRWFTNKQQSVQLAHKKHTQIEHHTIELVIHSVWNIKRTQYTLLLVSVQNKQFLPLCHLIFWFLVDNDCVLVWIWVFNLWEFNQFYANGKWFSWTVWSPTVQTHAHTHTYPIHCYTDEPLNIIKTCVYNTCYLKSQQRHWKLVETQHPTKELFIAVAGGYLSVRQQANVCTVPPKH